MTMQKYRTVNEERKKISSYFVSYDMITYFSVQKPIKSESKDFRLQ